MNARMQWLGWGALALLLALPNAAEASKVGWLDDVLQRVVRQSDPDLARPGRVSGRLLQEMPEESLSGFARRSDALAPATRGTDDLSEAALEFRFNRLMNSDPKAMRTFRGLAPAEKRMVVRLSEAAQSVARRYPDRADEMIRKLGVEGLTAVRVYGDDVAEVIAREGPESINVLRKTGRGGWAFYTGTVLQHKKKLAAAGVLALFLANPEQFVDTAGRVTEYAVRKFAEAGVDLAGAMGSGAARGLGDAFGVSELMGRVVVGVAVVVAVLAGLVMLGLPTGWLTRSVVWPFRLVGRGLRATVRQT